MANIRDLRKAKGLTQKQLAEMLNVTESHVSQIENGKRNPGYKMLIKLSKVFGVSVDEITQDKELQNDVANYVSSSLLDAIELSKNGQKNKPVTTSDDGREEDYEEMKDVFDQLNQENVVSLKEYALFLLQRQKSQGDQ